MSNDIRLLASDDIPMTKARQAEFATGLVDVIAEGELPAIETVVKLKALSDAIGTALKDTRVLDALCSEMESYGKGEAPSYQGARITVKEAGVKYDFSVCEDELWNELNRQIRELTEQRKQREKYLIARGGQVDDFTGEVYRIPEKTSTTTFSVTFSKE